MIDWWRDILSEGMPLMVNSGLFWLLFVLFFPFYGLLYRRKTAMTLYVLAFSLLLYYASGGWLVLLLVARAAIDYALSVAISRCRTKAVGKTLLCVALLLSVGALAYFKYAGFFVVNLNALLSANFRLVDVAAPLGISFYTFRSVSYLVEVYRRRVEVPKSAVDYAFYLSFFPALIAGPIARPQEFLPQIRENKRGDSASAYAGFWQVMRGLLKKAVIADFAAQYNNLVFANPEGYAGLEILLGVLGYGVQIYFDFSGYSDMAIGLARVMGFDLGENFRSPYKSRNIADFWRRWHISLSSWLRDYIYIPLGGNRKGRWRMALNLMVTMIVGGLWHGAGWNFLIWGGLHGLGLVVYKLAGRFAPELPGRSGGFVYGLCTFLFVNFLWIFFRSADLEMAVTVMEGIGSGLDFALLPAFWAERRLWCVVLVAGYVLMFMPGSVSAWAERAFVRSCWLVKLLLFCLLVQLILEMSGESVAPFIYANF